ncbi:MAG: hypothetical protein ACI84R_002596 [Candidatus Azotimanducaceae bacterium]|jgi:hypothetical protein
MPILQVPYCPSITPSQPSCSSHPKTTWPDLSIATIAKFSPGPDRSTAPPAFTRTVAEKDGTTVEPKPNDQVFIFSPNFSPAGSAPVKTKQVERNVSEPSESAIENVLGKVDLSRDDIDIEEKYSGYTVLLKLS